ncbi:MAG: hypothetical protein RL660_2937 [Bacteroidota bacterium]|jgi:type IV secretory pathway TraG/TraD family ATPase VirD4
MDNSIASGETAIFVFYATNSINNDADHSTNSGISAAVVATLSLYSNPTTQSFTVSSNIDIVGNAYTISYLYS